MNSQRRGLHLSEGGSTLSGLLFNHKGRFTNNYMKNICVKFVIFGETIYLSKINPEMHFCFFRNSAFFLNPFGQNFLSCNYHIC